ncbi:MAG: ABC transporter substrate-binding protein [Clostridium sp.]|nr:ABC transporter substrate-binding protein [Clostridium sp.]
MKKKLSLLLTTVLAISLLAGCGNKEAATNTKPEEGKKEVKLAQGVSDTEIKVGTIIASSGNFAMVGQPMLKGMQAYFKMVNDAGGVNGKKINLIAKDDGFQPNMAVQKAEELLETDKVFAIVGQLGTPGCLATIPKFQEAGIPAVYQGTGAGKFSTLKGNYFPVQPNYIYEGHLLISYALEQFKPAKIAILYQEDDMGKDELSGVEDQLKKLGKESLLVAKVPFAPTDLDFTSHIQKVAEQKPDVTIIAGMQAATPLILKQAKASGLKTQFMTSYVNADPTVIKNSAGGATGLVMPAWVNIVDTKDEKVKEYFDTYKKYNPNDNPNAFTAAGWVAGQVFVEGLKNTKGDLNWENFIKGMESIKDFNGLAKGVTYTPENRNGVQKMYFMKVKADGALEKVSDWVEAK